MLLNWVEHEQKIIVSSLIFDNFTSGGLFAWKQFVTVHTNNISMRLANSISYPANLC